jgi:hypothetical protein
MPIISHENVDLFTYPDIDTEFPSDKETQLTLGDLHGNALKLIYFLIRQNVLEITKNDYATLGAIYLKDPKELTKKELDTFCDIVKEAKVNPVGTIRLIGDEVADRGSNDYLTLKVLEKLKLTDMSVEILLSNHGAEFITAYETKNNFTGFIMYDEFIQSMTGLKILLKRNLVTSREVDNLINDIYKPSLRALSYTVNSDENKITLYSHALIGLRTIKDMAQKLLVKYKDKSIKNLADTINNINSEFQAYIKDNRARIDLYHEEAIRKTNSSNHLSGAFEITMWNRLVDWVKDDRPSCHNDYAIDFVHGHDLNDKTQDNIYNLDNTFGKQGLIRKHSSDGKLFLEKQYIKSTYHLLFSHEIPAARFQSKKKPTKALCSEFSFLRKSPQPQIITAALEEDLANKVFEVSLK